MGESKGYCFLTFSTLEEAKAVRRDIKWRERTHFMRIILRSWSGGAGFWEASGEDGAITGPSPCLLLE